jgi:NAD-dependent aldehyde dehydrogenases
MDRKMTEHLNHFIEGASFEASDGRRINLVNPVTEQVYGSSAQGTTEDVDRAVGAAHRRLRTWTDRSGGRTPPT